jgi:cellulose synthase operon protein C
MKRQWVRSTAAASATVALSLLLASCAGNPATAKLKYLQKGEAYMKKGQYSSAIIEFRNAQKVDPKYVEAYYQLYQASMDLSQADQAQGKPVTVVGQEQNNAYQALNQAIALDPARVDVRLARAELLATAKKDEFLNQATVDANYILKEDPKNADAHAVLGSILLKQKQYNQALQEFSKAAALAPNQPRAYLGMGVANLQLNGFDDAEANFKKAIQVDSHFVPAYLELADLYVNHQKKPDQAEQIVQAGIQANPSVLALYQALARFDLQQKQPAKAEQVLQAGIKANPSVVPFYTELASLYQSEGNASNAEATLTNLWNQLPKSPEAAVAIGDFYRQEKMDDRALAAYQRGLSANPQNLNIEESLENFYLDNQQTDLATNLDNEMLKQAPTDIAARIDQGRVLMEEGKTSEAIQDLQKLTTDAADSLGAHYYLAEAYLQNRQLDQANNEFQQMLRLSPPNPPSPLALAALVGLNSSEGKYSVAQLYAQELVQENGNNPRAHLMLGESLLHLGQLKQAGDEFATAQKLTPNDPDVHVALASLDITQKKLPEADSEFQAAVHAAPANPAIVEDYAKFLVSEKELPKASALVTQYAAHNPNESDAHFLMGQIDILEKNDAAAVAETQKALQLNPKSAGAYLQLGQLYQDQGNLSAAVQAYDQAASLTPASAPIITKIGDLYMQQGDLPKAIAQYQRALNVDPNLAPAANNLAWIYAEQGQNLDIALGLAQKAKAQQPNVPSFSDTLAWIMYRKGDYAEALPLLKDCVDKASNPAAMAANPGQLAQFTYHLGMVLIADGQAVQGKQRLQAALQMKALDSQDAAEARKALAQ